MLDFYQVCCNDTVRNQFDADIILDVRRMNVALTRAKSSLFVLGNTATLERSDETWRKIVQDARDRSALINVCICCLS